MAKQVRHMTLREMLRHFKLTPRRYRYFLWLISFPKFREYEPRRSRVDATALRVSPWLKANGFIKMKSGNFRVTDKGRQVWLWRVPPSR